METKSERPFRGTVQAQLRVAKVSGGAASISLSASFGLRASLSVGSSAWVSYTPRMVWGEKELFGPIPCVVILFLLFPSGMDTLCCLVSKRSPAGPPRSSPGSRFGAALTCGFPDMWFGVIFSRVALKLGDRVRRPSERCPYAGRGHGKTCRGTGLQI